MSRSYYLADFGRWVKIELAKREMKQRDLAQKLGISETSLSRYIHGRIPHGEMLADICMMFDCHVEIVPNKE